MLHYKSNEHFSKEEIKEQLEKVIQDKRKYCVMGKVASYIPELQKANPHHLAISVAFLNGEVIEAGDVEVHFTMQSISKVLTLALTLMEHGERVVFSKVGMEPTGDPFNSIVKLETTEPNKPLNPMINAGAIAVTSLLKGINSEDKIVNLLQFIREIANNPTITYNRSVAESESMTADLNRALAYFMKEHQVISGNIEEILDVYFKQCSIEVCSKDLAVIGAVFANEGKCILTNKVLIPADIARICKTFMITCGMYNASGEFAIKVGIPAKSGVSGGIMGSVPLHMGLGVYSPMLDKKGNSVAGLHLLESISTKWNLSIF